SSVFWLPRMSPSDDTSSLHTQAAPCSRQRSRNGASLTPARGAKNTGDSTSMSAMRRVISLSRVGARGREQALLPRHVLEVPVGARRDPLPAAPREQVVLGIDHIGRPRAAHVAQAVAHEHRARVALCPLPEHRALAAAAPPTALALGRAEA